jgi:hypothetical protein
LILLHSCFLARGEKAIIFSFGRFWKVWKR